MLTFEPYSVDALRRVLPYIRQNRSRGSSLSAGYLFMWQKGFDVRFCVWHDTFMVRQTFGDRPVFSWPIGADPDGMIDELIRCVRENCLPLRFFGIDESKLAALQADPRLSPVMAAYDRRWSDYLYDFEAARTFAGRKFSGQRNHINKFKRLYGEPAVRFLRPEDRPAVDAMLAAYAAEHPGGDAIERIEREQTRALLDVYESLGMQAACLTVNGAIAAFSVGEVIGDTLLIHVEKALRAYEGAYPTMYNGFVRLMSDRNLTVINREDDSGDPGLRISKQQYQPIGMVHKHLVTAHSPAAAWDGCTGAARGGVVLTPFRERDRAAYLKLNTDVENNRYWGYDYREDDSLILPLDEHTFFDSALRDMRAGESVNLAVRLSEDGDMIGEAIAWNFTFAGDAELGCRLFPEYQGKGYGAAAFGALAAFAEERLSAHPVAKCYKPNAASRRMIEGNGFVLTREDDTFYYFERPSGRAHA